MGWIDFQFKIKTQNIIEKFTKSFIQREAAEVEQKAEIFYSKWMNEIARNSLYSYNNISYIVFFSHQIKQL